MPLRIPESASSLVIRRQAFERANLVRAEIDALLELTDEEFRVEGDIVAVGPVFDAEALSELIAELETAVREFKRQSGAETGRPGCRSLRWRIPSANAWREFRQEP